MICVYCAAVGFLDFDTLEGHIRKMHGKEWLALKRRSAHFAKEKYGEEHSGLRGRKTRKARREEDT